MKKKYTFALQQIRKMTTILYMVALWLYSGAIAIASLFNKKARLLLCGRRETWRKLRRYVNDEKCVWIHAASLGEFEQGRPIIEALKAKYPEKKIVLTFYSPSGYEVRKKYQLCDLVCYLPADGIVGSRRFIEAVNPEVAIFVKYEFWHFYLKELKKHNIPTYGVSMIFREQQIFFKSHGGWFRHMLKNFSHIYVQDEASKALLDGIGVTQNTVAGDTRFDRVAAIAESAQGIDLAAKFVGGFDGTVIVAGSTWEPDEELLLAYVNNPDNNVKLIIAPHEIDDARVKGLCSKLSVEHFRYTAPPANPELAKVMVVNTMGMLSAIYRYGHIAYVGGGFGVGIHNTLEAATYGMPVIFGPKYKKFKEACDLIDCGAGFTIKNEKELRDVLDTLRTDIQRMAQAKEAASRYVKSMCGATELIMKKL